MPALACFVTQSGRDVALAEADAAHEHDIGFAGDKAESEEVFDLKVVDLLGPVPAERVHGLDHGEARVADAPGDGTALAGAAFAFHEAPQVVEVRPAFRRGVGGECFALRGDVAEFEISEVFVEQVGRRARGGGGLHEVGVQR